MSPEQIRDGFQHGKLDLALTTYPLIEPGIEWEQVLEEELVLVLGPEHPLAGHKEISFAELKGWRSCARASAATCVPWWTGAVPRRDFTPM